MRSDALPLEASVRTLHALELLTAVDGYLSSSLADRRAAGRSPRGRAMDLRVFQACTVVAAAADALLLLARPIIVGRSVWVKRALVLRKARPVLLFDGRRLMRMQTTELWISVRSLPGVLSSVTADANPTERLMDIQQYKDR